MNKILNKISLLLFFCLLTVFTVGYLKAADNIFTLIINEMLPGETEATKIFSGQFLLTGEEIQRDVQLSPHTGYQAVLDPDPSTGTCILSLKDDNTISYHILSTQSAGELTATVTYAPAEVSYTVNYYQQNVGNNDYTLVEARTLYGITGTLVDAAAIKDAAHTYEGFARRPFMENTTIAADGTTVINVYNDRNYYMISFDPNGAPDAPNAMFMRFGTPISGIQAPERSGYTFNGWLPALPETMPAENMVCAAQWERATTICKVNYVFWGENADDTDYSYLLKVERQYDVTTKPTASYEDVPLDSISDDVFPTKAGYTVNETESDTNKEILADGTTLVNVYLDRNLYTIELIGRNGSSVVASVENAKWGSNIKTEWMSAIRNNGFKWYPANITKPGDNYPWTFLMITMPIGGGRYTTDNNSGSTLTINFLTDTPENPGVYNQTYATISGDAKEFVLQAASHPDIEGYTYVGSTPVSDGELVDPKKGTPTLNFRYTIGKYNLLFKSGTEFVREYNNVLCGKILTSVDSTLADYVPRRPGAIPSSYQFAGWTLDPETLGDSIDLSAYSMPGKDLVLYAKWIPPEYTIVAYQTSTLEKQVLEPQIIKWGTTIEDLPSPESPIMRDGMTGYTFVNWFYKDENGIEYIFDAAQMTVKSDMVLYGKWMSDTFVDYELHFEDMEGNEIAEAVFDQALGGSNLTVTAKSISGYFPEVYSTSLFIDLNDPTKNVYTFKYRQPQNVPYTVRYLDKKGNVALAEAKVVNDNTFNVVTEQFVPIDNYVVDAAFKMLHLEAKSDDPQPEDNVITFYYERNDDQVTITVSCFINQDLSGDAPNYVLDPNLSMVEYVDKPSDLTATYTLAAEKIPAIAHYTLNTTKSTSATQEYTEHGIDYVFYYDPITYTITYTHGVDGYAPWMSANVLEGGSTPIYTGDMTYPVAALASDYFFKGWDKSIAATVTENAIYTAEWDGYFHVHHCIGTAPSADDVVETLKVQDIFDITKKAGLYKGITDGCLYAGLWSDETGTALLDYDVDGICGLELQPEAGDHYYVREISNAYLTPKTLTVRIKGEYQIAIVSAIDDPEKYIATGFDVTTGGNDCTWIASAYDTLTVNYADTTKKPSVYTAGDVFTGLTGKMICSDVEKDEGEQKLTFKPFLATLDSVKVFGTKERTVIYSTTKDSSKSDADIDLPCEFYGTRKDAFSDANEIVRLSTIVPPAFVLGETAAPEVSITVNIGDMFNTVTVPAGTDFTERISNPSVGGSVFAGWFRDEACTRPANLSCVTEDIEIYAGFMSDSYLQVAEIPAAGGADAARIRLVAAVDTILASEYGFIISDENGTREISVSECYDSIDGYTAAELFGDVDEYASLICQDVAFSSMESGKEIMVTPYWIPLAGAKVTGTPKRIVVSGR